MPSVSDSSLEKELLYINVSNLTTEQIAGIFVMASCCIKLLEQFDTEKQKWD